MEGIYYAVFVITILVVIRWAMQDDLAGGEGNSGFFAMSTRRKKEGSKRRRRSRFQRSEGTD